MPAITGSSNPQRGRVGIYAHDYGSIKSAERVITADQIYEAYDCNSANVCSTFVKILFPSPTKTFFQDKKKMPIRHPFS